VISRYFSFLFRRKFSKTTSDVFLKVKSFYTQIKGRPSGFNLKAVWDAGYAEY